MSQKNVEQAGRSGTRSIRLAERRTWEDHIAVRFPRAHRRLATMVWRVFTRRPAGHPLRRAIAERVIGRSYGAFNRNDLDVLIALYHPECVWDWSHFEGWPDDPISQGPEGMLRGWQVFREAWGNFRASAKGFEDFGDYWVVTCRLQATGSGSGVGIERTWWQVGYSRDGLLALVANYTDREEALEAAGLSEQDAHADS
jgi:hypothetical protein